jgi:predicted dehydrogenase
MSNVLRVGIIGYGMAARLMHIPLIAGTDGLELAALRRAFFGDGGG